MAIIYSYPDNLNILLTDMLIGTSTIKVAGKKKNITKNFTVEALGKVISTANPTVWGTIIGNLDDQTDLQAALDSKQNNITLTTIGSNGPSTLIGSVLNIPNYFTVVPTKTSELINDGEDGINPFITLADIPPSPTPNLNDVLLEGNTATNNINLIGNYYGDNFYINTGGFGLMDDGTLLGQTFQFVNSFNSYLYTSSSSLNTWELPNQSGTIALTSDIPAQGLTSVGLTMPVAFNVANSPLTSDGTIAVSAAGTSSQYIRGDGQLATFPTSGGGGSSVNYYLNGSINASVAGYKQLSNTATIGGGTDFTLVGNGLIAQFLTDLGNPNRTEIPGGAWNFEMFFQASSAGGNQKFYVELLKYDGTTFTSIASSVSVPEEITGGTAIDLYLTSLAVPTTPLLVTDRLAIRVYIVDNAVGRTITLHTEDNTLCEIITTFSGGVTSLNGLTANTQYLAVGTTGTDFNISSLTDTHTFNLPTASATNRGALSTTDWTTFNGKFTLPSLTSGSVLFSNGTTIAQDNSNFFWDDTNNRLGIGTNAPNSRLHLTGSITAAAAIARGVNITPTLVAAANNDTLIGLDINPTFTNGAFSGVNNIGLRIQNVLSIRANTSGNTAIIQSLVANTDFYGKSDNTGGISFYGGGSYLAGAGVIVCGSSNGTNPNTILFTRGTFTETARFNASGNFLLNTTTDNGGKLQIKAGGALSTDIALRVRNSADTGDLMTVGGNGNVRILGKIALNDGGNSVFIGTDAGASDDASFNNNVGLGYQALYSNTTGANNVANGWRALYSNTTGNNNAANGYQSLFSNTTGGNNAANGSQSLRSNTTGDNNVANGYQSLFSNTTGNNNAANGYQSLFSNTTGNNNTANGSQSLRSNTTGGNNTANGYQSLYSNTTGSDNVANGLQSLFLNTTGNNNTANGFQSGRYIANKSTAATILNNSIMIGYRTSPLADNETNQIVIGYDAIGIGSNSVVLGNDSITKTALKGNVLVGTTTEVASAILNVNSTTKGFLPPRMTNAQRIAIATPAVGLCVYCTDAVEGLYINKSTGWTFIG